jgi:hypothetical protein
VSRWGCLADAADPAVGDLEDQVDNVYRPLQAMARSGPLGHLMKVGEEFIRVGSDGPDRRGHELGAVPVG